MSTTICSCCNLYWCHQFRSMINTFNCSCIWFATVMKSVGTNTSRLCNIRSKIRKITTSIVIGTVTKIMLTIITTSTTLIHDTSTILSKITYTKSNNS